MMEKTCNVCEAERACFDEPMDANKCRDFRNAEIAKMEKAIEIIEGSEWLKQHDAELIAEFVEFIKGHSMTKTATIVFEKPCEYVQVGGKFSRFAAMMAIKFIEQMQKGNS